ncbi:hypothetical protein HKBW3S25_00757, partial [Candidatus Hakubella thermalkaliphila]
MQKLLIEKIKAVPKYVYLISLSYALFYPTLYLILYLTTPSGYGFTWGWFGDDGILLSLMRSVENNLICLWASQDKVSVFAVPGLTSPYIYVPLGYISYFLRIPYQATMIVSGLIARFVLLIVIFFFLSEFVSREKVKIFYLVYTLTSGFGGLIFFLSTVVSNPASLLEPRHPFYGFMATINYELFEGVGLVPITMMNRLYYLLPMILGLVGLIFLKKHFDSSKVPLLLFSGLLYAVTFLFYPIYGISFSLISLIYGLTRLVSGEKQHVMEYLKKYSILFSLAVVGLIPWIITLIYNRKMLDLYSAIASSRARITPLFLSLCLLLIFVFYDFFYQTRNRKILAAILVSIVSLIFYELSMLHYLNREMWDFWPGFMVQIFAFVRRYYKYGFILLTLAGLYLLPNFLRNTRLKDLEYSFFYVALSVFFILSILPKMLLYNFNMARFMHFLWLPLSILASNGILKVSGKNWIRNAVLAMVITISSFSFFFYSVFFITFPHQRVSPTYYRTEELEAMNYLQKKPMGTVLSSERIAYYLPFFSNKFSLLGGEQIVVGLDKKKQDYERFFNWRTQSKERLEILNRYHIDYVFVSKEDIDQEVFDRLDDEKFLSLVFYEGTT